MLTMLPLTNCVSHMFLSASTSLSTSASASSSSSLTSTSSSFRCPLNVMFGPQQTWHSTVLLCLPHVTAKLTAIQNHNQLPSLPLHRLLSTLLPPWPVGQAGVKHIILCFCMYFYALPSKSMTDVEILRQRCRHCNYAKRGRAGSSLDWAEVKGHSIAARLAIWVCFNQWKLKFAAATFMTNLMLNCAHLR